MKTNKQAAEIQKWKQMKYTNNNPNVFSEWSYLEGYKNCESQLMPLIKEMREFICVSIPCECRIPLSVNDVKEVYVCDKCETLASIEQKLKEIKGE